MATRKGKRFTHGNQLTLLYYYLFCFAFVNNVDRQVTIAITK
uniref:Uncharacterized protein n=1 Tax=Arundo donax TaxID=35708 RepID=A0A0A9GZ29_ARUDO